MKTNRKFGISFKLSLFFSILSVSLLTLIAVIAYNMEKKNSTAFILQRLDMKVKDASHDIESWFQERQRIVDTVSVVFDSEKKNAGSGERTS